MFCINLAENHFMDSDGYSSEIFTLLRQFFPLLISLLDDVLAVALARFGCQVPWLEKIMPFVFSGVTLYVVIHAGKVIYEFWQRKRHFPSPPNVSSLQ